MGKVIDMPKVERGTQKVNELTIPMELTPVSFRLKLLYSILITFLGASSTVTLFHFRKEK